jgi:predicted phage tail protein
MNATTFEGSYMMYERSLHTKKTRVLLYGHLRKKFGKLHELSISSPAEAVRALSRRFPGFFKAVRFHQPGFAVFIGKDNIEERCLTMCNGGEDIKIVPMTSGSGNANWMQVIIGSVLIAVGVVIGITTGWSGAGLVVAKGFITAGAAMIIGGVANMLFAPSPPDIPQESDGHKPSYLFDGPVNTYAQGHCIPVLLGGPLRVGSCVISASLVAEEWHDGGDLNDSTTGDSGVDDGSGIRHWRVKTT